MDTEVCRFLSLSAPAGLTLFPFPSDNLLVSPHQGVYGLPCSFPVPTVCMLSRTIWGAATLSLASSFVGNNPVLLGSQQLHLRDVCLCSTSWAFCLFSLLGTFVWSLCCTGQPSLPRCPTSLAEAREPGSSIRHPTHTNIGRLLPSPVLRLPKSSWYWAGLVSGEALSSDLQNACKDRHHMGPLAEPSSDLYTCAMACTFLYSHTSMHMHTYMHTYIHI